MKVCSLQKAAAAFKAATGVGAYGDQRKTNCGLRHSVSMVGVGEAPEVMVWKRRSAMMWNAAPSHGGSGQAGLDSGKGS